MNLKDIETRDKIAYLNDELDDHQETIEKIREIIDQLCSDYACKIDFWKTPYGQKILEIKGILNESEY